MAPPKAPKMPMTARSRKLKEKRSCFAPSIYVLARTRTVRNRRFRDRQNRSDFIGRPDIEKHSFGDFAHHFARRQVHNKQRLLSLNLLWIVALLSDAGQYRSLVIAKIDGHPDEFVRFGHIFDKYDRPNANVELREVVEADHRLHGSWSHAGIKPQTLKDAKP